MVTVIHALHTATVMIVRLAATVRHMATVTIVRLAATVRLTATEME
jgi:hypothetical protein